MLIQPNRFNDPFTSLFAQIDSVGQIASSLSGPSFGGQIQSSPSLGDLFGFSSPFSSGGSPLMGSMQDLTQLMGLVGSPQGSLGGMLGGLMGDTLAGGFDLFGFGATSDETPPASPETTVVDSPDSGLSQDELRLIDGADGRIDGRVDIMLENGQRLTKKGAKKLGKELKGQLKDMDLSKDERQAMIQDIERDVAVLNKAQKLLKGSDREFVDLRDLSENDASFLAKPLQDSNKDKK